MKRYCRAGMFLVCAGLAVFTPAWSQQQSADSHEKDQRAIQAVDDATRRAAQARNAKDVVDVFYADDGSAMYPNAPICTGKEALYKRWSQMLATPGFSVDWHLTKIEVSRSGDLAYTPFTYEMTMPGQNGKVIAAARASRCGKSKLMGSGKAKPTCSIPTCRSAAVLRSNNGVMPHTRPPAHKRDSVARYRSQSLTS